MTFEAGRQKLILGISQHVRVAVDQARDHGVLEQIDRRRSGGDGVGNARIRSLAMVM